MIEVEKLCFAYQTESPIFTDFNWSATQGERWSVIGPSGCGKTTLLYLLAGLLLPASGKINIDGSLLTQPRLSTGLILQGYGLLPWATASKNIALGLRLRQVDKERINQLTEVWLTRLGIESVSHHYPAELSGGQQQRVAIARTLVLEPDLLLMDEPFASLDALTREDLQNSLISLGENMPLTMVLVTHNIEEAVFLGKRILVLKHPSNTKPIIVENPGAGYSEYRKTSDFTQKCKEVRGLVDRSVSP
ncbi:Aliphatic sulfonates import ATP-binding protein SsuB [subsurface metagenome]